MFLSPGLHLCVSGTYYAKPHFRRAANQSSTDMNACHIFFLISFCHCVWVMKWSSLPWPGWHSCSLCVYAWGARRLTNAHFRSVARVRRRLSAAGLPVSCRLSPIGGAYGGVVSVVYGRFMARHLDGLRPSDDKIGYNNTYHNRKSFGLTVTCVMEIHTIMLFCWIEFYLTETSLRFSFRRFE